MRKHYLKIFFDLIVDLSDMRFRAAHPPSPSAASAASLSSSASASSLLTSTLYPMAGRAPSPAAQVMHPSLLVHSHSRVNLCDFPFMIVGSVLPPKACYCIFGIFSIPNCGIFSIPSLSRIAAVEQPMAHTQPHFLAVAAPHLSSSVATATEPSSSSLSTNLLGITASHRQPSSPTSVYSVPSFSPTSPMRRGSRAPSPLQIGGADGSQVFVNAHVDLAFQFLTVWSNNWRQELFFANVWSYE
jgi:hypothetical protein